MRDTTAAPRAPAPLRAASLSPPTERRTSSKAPSPARQVDEKPPTETQGKRSRGRPAIGPANKVRVSPAQEDFVLELGKGNFAEGVRQAIEFTRERTHGAKRAPTGQPQSAVIVPTALIAEVSEIGNGSFIRGLATLVKAARVQTFDAIRKLARG